MKTLLVFRTLLIVYIGLLSACNNQSETTKSESGANTAAGSEKDLLSLPEPYATPSSTKRSKTIGWPAAKTPTAPAGFDVTVFANNLKHPRWLYVMPNGDVLVAESNDEDKGSANRITLFRDADKDGKPETRQVFLSNLNQPLGMVVVNNAFYVANTDGLVRYPYQSGQTRINGQGKKILDLPAGGYNHHWTRSVVANADGSKLYVSVGSASNVGEYGMDEEKRRAAILEINPDGTGERIYASGLRNPVGTDWAPGTGTLYAAVNERDGLGDNLVPDYLTSVQDGGFYGWPYSYFGPHIDPRRKGESPELVQKAIVPDVPLQAHSASLGLAFYDGNAFPEKYHNGAFIGQHGSWNRSEFVGYKVVFVPFTNGKPSGQPQDFLTGFIANQEAKEVYGRPVGLAVMADGSLLVADDEGNTIWQVRASQR